MPKITIKNLSAEKNRRIKLIKTPTSVVELGQQQGAVVDAGEYIGICLAPLQNPVISCDGAGQITGLAIGYYFPDGSNEDTWIVAEQVRLKFNNEERFIALNGTAPPYTSEYPEIGNFFNQYLAGANGDFDQAPFEGEIGFWQNPDPLNPVRFEYELLPANQTQFRVATFGDNPAHENVTPIFTRACFAPYQSPISCAGAESTVEMAFAIKDGTGAPLNVSFLLDNNPVDLMNNPPPYITKEILNKLYDGEVPAGFSTGAGVLKFTNTDAEPHRIECFTDDFQNIRVLANHNSSVINLDNEIDWIDVGVCLSQDVGIPIGCEGSVDYITVGLIKDGSMVDVYLNDELLPVNTKFFLRNGGGAIVLGQYGIQVEALDSQGLPAIMSDGRYTNAALARFINMTPSFQKLRFDLLDAPAIDQNNTIENESFFFDSSTRNTSFCLSPSTDEGCQPSEIIMVENDQFEGGSVSLDYEVEALSHSVINVSKRFSMTDIPQGTYLSEIVRQVILQIKEDYPFIAIRDSTGTEIANFDFWTYRSESKGTFSFSGVNAVLSEDPMVIKFVKNGLDDDLFPLLFPDAASNGTTSYVAHSCGTQELIGI
ncbi:hypothetical protein F889_02602 [Acinetobacter colistiniresistens]|uniref:Uncharacterized protein n=1 Tax=Acinetobacter colistiniresistens TaxID=280145 RepID=N9PKF4_9GAMM|nr:hypothetical protein [Acinetobacter colistiniresistens]ENX33938.1 hypothetical protein F889_02602 [Acinetobacter colistiniresistens]